MRSWLLLLCILPWFPSAGILYAADPPFPLDLGVSYPSPHTTAADLPPPPQADPFFATGPQQRFDIDVLLGLPTALRVEGAVFRKDDRAILVEGVAGLEVILPLIGGGVRYRFAPCYGERNAFVVKPGIDAYYVVNSLQPLFGGPQGAFSLGVDVELVWFHNCGRCGRCGWELGLDLGVLTNPGNGWAALPIVSVITGVRF